MNHVTLLYKDRYHTFMYISLFAEMHQILLAIEVPTIQTEPGLHKFYES